MQANQKVGCSVNNCMHYKNGDMCRLNAVQIFPCSDEGHNGHDSVCYSFQEMK